MLSDGQMDDLKRKHISCFLYIHIIYFIVLLIKEKFFVTRNCIVIDWHLTLFYLFLIIRNYIIMMCYYNNIC